MCGRFSFSPNEILIEERFDLEVEEGSYTPRYNCAPSQNLAVVSNHDPGKLSYFRWGLIPFWARDPAIGNRMINARAEGILEKPSFRNPFRQRRCLVLSDGFFEWKRTSVSSQQSAACPDERSEIRIGSLKEAGDGRQKAGGKVPYRIVMKNGDLFAMAGIWDAWKDADGSIIRSFAIITTTPNELMSPIHDRMPVILPRRFEKEWLTSDRTGDLTRLLEPYPSEEMEAYPVSWLVNNPANDNPAVIARR
ncbi:MAG TPA: SOS response-associated peptidase [Bacteroidales bacterium]|nr:SOS response-associated peptidase [Bacteroidales bacterium]HRZ20129.1 SOS response-associated peptidase [Bacteroidales bacterium]